MVCLPLRADIINGYVETFDSADPSASGYHPRGWERHYYSSYYAATYSTVDCGDGNLALSVEQRYPGSSGYDDYLVTPVVSGRVTIKLRLASSGGSMKFYKVTESYSGSFSKVEEMTPDISPALSSDAFQEVGFSDIPEGTRIGLRGHDIIFDDFSAQTADVVYKKSLDLTARFSSSEPEFTNTGSSYSPVYTITLSEDNMLSLSFNVTLENDGEVAFLPGDEGYSVSLSANEAVLGTQLIDEPLEPGESLSKTVTFSFNASQLSGAVTFLVRENIGESYELQKITIVPYRPEFKLQDSESTSSYSTIQSGSPIDFGSSQTTLSKTVWIYNTGTAPLSFSIDLDSDSFTASTEGITTVEAGTHIPCTLATVADGAFGPRTATLTFDIEDVGTYTVYLKATMIDPERWFENFSSKQLPVDMVDTGNIWNFSSGAASVTTNSDGAKLITPKLTVAADETLEIRIAKNGSSYYTKPTFKAYLSNDRKDWTLIEGDYPVNDLGTDFEVFTISGIEPGDYYLGFDCSNVRISEFYGFRKADISHDVIVTSSVIPAQGEVNTLYKASIGVRNVGNALEEGSFKAVLSVGGAEAASLMPATLAPGESASYELAFTPHAVNPEAPVCIRLLGLGEGGETVIATSETIMAAFGEEVMRSEVTVGTPSSTTNRNGPAYTSYNYSYYDIIYPADKIPLEQGAKINRIAFKGKSESAGTSSHIKVWIENTDQSSLPNTQNTWADLDDNAASKDFVWDFPLTDGEEVLVIDLTATPFIYDGRNIRMRFKNQASKTGTVQYITDSNAGVAAYDYDNSATYTPKTYKAQPVVAFISIEASPIAVTGTVTDSDSGDPVAEAGITVKSGDVEYYGKSNESGIYSVDLMKDIAGYMVNVAVPGYFQYSAPLADVIDNSVTHNVSLTPARGLCIKSQSIPSNATVNEGLTLEALVQNVNTTPFTADSFTVTLLVDGIERQSQPGSGLAANNGSFNNPASEHLFSFSLTCHEAGLHTIAFRIDMEDGKSISGAPVQLNVTEELAGGRTRLGNPDGYSTNSPAAIFYSYSTSSTLYPASKIEVPAGAEITELRFDGYYNSMSESDAVVEVWLQNTDDLPDADPVFDTSQMTKVASKAFNFKYKGSPSEAVEMMSFTFDEPFFYSGSSLRMVVRTESTGYNAGFETDRTGTTWYKRSNSSFEQLENASPMADDMCVANLTFSNSRHFRGNVVSEEDAEPVCDASVILSSGDVRYSGTTDDLGHFDIPVIRHTLPYKLSITADGFLPKELNEVALGEENTHVLKKDLNAGVNDALNIGRQDKESVYTLQGLKAQPRAKGITVSKGRKTISN